MEVKLPVGTGPLQNKHRRYLINRGFNPDELARQWGLQGTGHLGDYKHRIIIPITHHNRLVAYTSRDITGKSPLRYKNCPVELGNVKHYVYGLDQVIRDRVIVVEGPVDAWRLGIGIAVSTLGITWTMEQVNLILSSRIRYVSILYDNQPQAQEQADLLAEKLRDMSVEVLCLDEIKDPGELDQLTVKKLFGEVM